MESLEAEARKYTGGVEEEKEEGDNFSPEQLLRNNKDSSQQEAAKDKADVGDEKGFRAQLEEFSRFFLGSCSNVIDAARFLGCRWPNHEAHPGGVSPAAKTGDHHAIPDRPQLSIAEELRRLAAQEGPVFRPRAADIPRFLGEDAVYSFEDDNVSAISQHTLEEMARKGKVSGNHHHHHPMCRSSSNISHRTPSPGRTRSSTSSSKDPLAVDDLRNLD